NEQRANDEFKACDGRHEREQRTDLVQLQVTLLCEIHEARYGAESERAVSQGEHGNVQREPATGEFGPTRRTDVLGSEQRENANREEQWCGECAEKAQFSKQSYHEIRGRN